MRENLILLLANDKGTDKTATMSKPACLSVEIVTDKPAPVKISIPQLVSVAKKTGLSLTWSQPQHACVSTVHANLCYLNFFKNILHVSDRVQVHVHVINFKQFETLSKFRT